MAIARPQTVTPWADSGSQLAPSGGELASGFVSVSRPGFRKLNWLLNYAMNGIRYLSQRGIPDWAADDSYSVGAVVTGPDTVTYKAIGVPTVGLAPGSDSTNWTVFPYLAPFYGDGSSGDRTVTTDTSATPLGAHVNYNNLTLSSSGVIKATYDPAIAASVNPIIRVRGTLSVAAGGIIHANGGSASGVTGGAGNASAFANNGAVTQAIFGNFIGGGTGGLNGLNGSTIGSALRLVVNGTSDGGSPYLSSPDMLVGATASGPNGLSLTGPPTGHSGGSAGGQSTGTVTLTASQVLALMGMPGMIPSRQIAPNHTAIAWIPLHGGLGGGSGGFLTSDSTGGAGGAGGGVLYIFANNLVLGSATALQALGGAGGVGSGTSASGGSGGSGGRVIIVCRTFSGVTPTTACVAGGAGGAGIGVVGQTGTTGNTGNLVFVTGV